MGITDELREWAARELASWKMARERFDALTAIADRIDERVTELLRKQDADLRAEFDAMNDGWVRLPVGADGEAIHVGDKVDSDYYEDGTVTGIQFYETADGGIRTRIAVRPDGWDVATWYAPDGYRHHHEPTVEDVLREMCLEIDRRCERGGIDYDRLFDEYAAKLRLREDA